MNGVAGEIATHGIRDIGIFLIIVMTGQHVSERLLRTVPLITVRRASSPIG